MKRIVLILLIMVNLFSEGCKKEKKNIKEVNEVIELLYKQKYDEVIDLSTKHIKKFPRIPDLYYARGFAYFREGMRKEAQSDFEKCIKIKPEYGNCYSGIASVYESRSNIELAEKSYLKAIELVDSKTSKSAAYNNLGSMYTRDREFDKALKYFKKALEINDKGEFYLNIGSLYFMRENVDEAIKMWENGIKKEYDELSFLHETYFKLAVAYFVKKKEYEKALKHAKKAVELEPEDNDYKNLLNDIKKKIN